MKNVQHWNEFTWVWRINSNIILIFFFLCWFTQRYCNYFLFLFILQFATNCLLINVDLKQKFLLKPTAVSELSCTQQSRTSSVKSWGWDRENFTNFQFPFFNTVSWMWIISIMFDAKITIRYFYDYLLFSVFHKWKVFFFFVTRRGVSFSLLSRFNLNQGFNKSQGIQETASVSVHSLTCLRLDLDNWNRANSDLNNRNSQCENEWILRISSAGIEPQMLSYGHELNGIETAEQHRILKRFHKTEKPFSEIISAVLLF